MNIPIQQIIDANLNRVSEGLRVIEEYTRFLWKNKPLTDQLAALRKQVNSSETTPEQNLLIRNIESDMRAMDPPTQRKTIWDLLKANFKRAEEGLRVLEEYTGLPLYNQLRYELYQLEKAVLLPLAQKEIHTPGIYLISDQEDVLLKGLSWGVSLIQYRAKTATKPEKLAAARRLQAAATVAKIPFIINDDIDIALLVDCDGFHSGQDDLSVTEQRKLLGAHKIIGKTTHDLEQGKIAQAQGADYVSVGPIWETPSKAGRAGIGVDYLRQASTELSIPFVAIGGIDLARFQELLPYSPPLIGLIRDYTNIPEMLNQLKKD